MQTGVWLIVSCLEVLVTRLCSFVLQLLRCATEVQPKEAWIFVRGLNFEVCQRAHSVKASYYIFSLAASKGAVFFFSEKIWEAESSPATRLLIYAKFMLHNMEGNLSLTSSSWLMSGSASPILRMLHPFQDFVRLVLAISKFVYGSLFGRTGDNCTGHILNLWPLETSSAQTRAPIGATNVYCSLQRCFLCVVSVIFVFFFLQNFPGLSISSALVCLAHVPVSVASTCRVISLCSWDGHT